MIDRMRSARWTSYATTIQLSSACRQAKGFSPHCGRRSTGRGCRADADRPIIDRDDDTSGLRANCAASLHAASRNPGSHGGSAARELHPSLAPICGLTLYLGTGFRIVVGATMGLKIGELAERAEVNLQTLRYYEREKLLPEPPRLSSGYRAYPDSEYAVSALSSARRTSGLPWRRSGNCSRCA